MVRTQIRRLAAALLAATGTLHLILAPEYLQEKAYDLTAIAGESMAEQLLDGSARRPGLHRMGLIVDPDRLLADMEAMGVRVETSPAGR